jgi:hypothetical protein
MAVNTSTVRFKSIATLVSVIKDMLAPDFANWSSRVLNVAGVRVIIIGVDIDIFGIPSRSWGSGWGS